MCFYFLHLKLKIQICLGPQNDECDRWHESESPRSREPEPGCETAPTRHPTLDLDARGGWAKRAPNGC